MDMRKIVYPATELQVLLVLLTSSKHSTNSNPALKIKMCFQTIFFQKLFIYFSVYFSKTCALSNECKTASWEQLNITISIWQWHLHNWLEEPGCVGVFRFCPWFIHSAGGMGFPFCICGSVGQMAGSVSQNKFSQKKTLKLIFFWNTK